MDKRLFSLPKDKITAFFQRWKVTEFAVFGSSLRQDFNALSDIDVLVSFDDLAEITLLDLAQMQIELERDLPPKADPELVIGFSKNGGRKWRNENDLHQNKSS